jgi:hypothetical protein
MKTTITRKPPSKYTPWGEWQDVYEHAPGIVFVSTARHGGFHLDAERRKEAHARIGKLPTFTGSQAWLEEDCDACLVYLIWPEYATDEQINDAVNTVNWQVNNCSKWESIQKWLYRAGREDLLDRAKAHQEAVKDLWERGSLWTVGKGWNVSFTRPGTIVDKARRTVEFERYPRKRYYTTEELDAIEQAAKAVTS